MKYDKEYRIEKFKRNVASFLKCIFCIIYFFSTSFISIYVFYFIFSLKNSLIYAAAFSGISIIGMDIVCSILEDGATKIYKIFVNIKRKRQRVKEEKIKRLEQLLLERNDYNREIQQVKKENKDFKKEIKNSKEKLPENITEMLIKVCKKVDGILEVLEKDTEEYYPIRHTFKAYFPEFQKITYQFINIAKRDSLDRESISEFIELITKINQHLDYIKGSINTQDKLSLSVGIKSLIKIIETEREKGDT